jgi:uncharacterized membrane protein
MRQNTLTDKVAWNAEAELIDLGKFTIFGGILSGFFPFTLVSSNRKLQSLRFNYFSISHMWAIFISTVLGLIIYMMYQSRYKLDSTNAVADMTMTEIYTSYTLSLIMVGLSLWNRCVGLIGPRDAVELWREQCLVIEEIGASDVSGCFKIGFDRTNTKHASVFRKLQSEFRIASTFGVVFLLLISSFLLAAPPEILMTKRVLNERDEDNPERNFHPMIIQWAMFVWFLCGQMRFFVILWLVFPMKLMKAFLTVIYEELRQFETNLTEYYVDQDRISKCIANFNRISKLFYAYEDHSWKKLLVEIFFNAIVILFMGFMGVQLINKGMAGDAIVAFCPAPISIFVLWYLGTAAGELTLECDKVFEAFCRLPTYKLDNKLKERVHFLVLRLSKNSLNISPGNEC